LATEKKNRAIAEMRIEAGKHLTLCQPNATMPKQHIARWFGTLYAQCLHLVNVTECHYWPFELQMFYAPMPLGR